MSRISFLYLGVTMLFLFAFQAEDLLGRATRGAMDLGRMFSTWWTLLTALMLLAWFCLQVTIAG